MEKTTELSIDEKIEKIDKMPRMMKLRLLGLMDENTERNKRLRPIFDYYESDKDTFVMDIHELGETYQIVKIRCKKKDREDEIYFTPFINYKSTNTLHYTLEEAVIAGIADKFDGSHSSATYYISKMLGIYQER